MSNQKTNTLRIRLGVVIFGKLRMTLVMNQVMVFVKIIFFVCEDYATTCPEARGGIKTKTILKIFHVFSS